MDSESSDRERHPHDDPALEALLAFEPVPRRVERENGWSADNQRAFIAGLVETGNYRLAAQRLGLTASGVYQLRKDAGAEDFARAWDEAIALHKARNPRRLESPASAVRMARRSRRPDIDPAEAEEIWRQILKKYLLKLKAERRSRLEGRIVEADFYVRQLTMIEIVFDIGGKAQELIEGLKAGAVPLAEIVATPGSVLLDKARRAYWREKGEVDRPALAALGRHGHCASTGEPSHHHYNAARDGDFAEWERRETAKAALRAEAQAAWEEKARKDAEAWAKRQPE